MTAWASAEASDCLLGFGCLAEADVFEGDVLGLGSSEAEGGGELAVAAPELRVAGGQGVQGRRFVYLLVGWGRSAGGGLLDEVGITAAGGRVAEASMRLRTRVSGRSWCVSFMS